MKLEEEIKKSYNNFFKLEYFDIGEGVWFINTASWLEARRRAKERFRTLFSINNLNHLEKEDFKKFLYFKYNYEWTTLYRTGLQSLNNFEKVKETIRFLQNEDIDIVTRIREVLDTNGEYHVKGIGKNIATGILHVVDVQDRYGVWNNVVEKGLSKLGVFSRVSTNPGLIYYRINEVLNYLKKIINSDSLVWYIAKYT